MKVKTAYSQKSKIEAVIADIKQQIGTFDARFIQFFSSTKIDPEKISPAMQSAFPKVPMLGCSTSGEIITSKMLDDSIVVMAFGPEIIGECKVEVLQNIDHDSMAVDKAFVSLAGYFKSPMQNLDPDKYLGIVLIDGLSGMEEKINERIGDLTNISFVGGSAGDDLKFNRTFVFANGKAYSNAAVIALIKSKTRFEVLKTQSFVASKKKAVITKADESKRAVLELNNKPANMEYARLVGIKTEKLVDAFATNPLGLVFEKEIYVRSPQRVEDNKVYFYCGIKEGMELSLLEATDIVSDTRKAVEVRLKKAGKLSAIVNFNCILRTLELKAKKQTDDYGQIFSSIPTIGFSTYGESYIGHINQTSVMLLFS